MRTRMKRMMTMMRNRIGTYKSMLRLAARALLNSTLSTLQVT